MTAPEPPDWALPNWDLPATRIARVPSAPLAKLAPLAQAGDIVGPGPLILGVSDVTRAVRDAVRGDDRLKDVWVEGEVGRVTVSTAGHGYFSLQDARSQLACVFFRDDRVASPFQPQSGLRVVAHGRVDVFDSQGVYQLYVSSLQPAGFGDLALRFEALKAKLQAEGLFDAGRKRPLPLRPSVVAVVTSPTGAVWHDIRNVLTRRWPMTRVLMVPCLVQGDTAPGSIVGALDRLGRWVARLEREGRAGDAPSVTILARGGGSLEDLWPFNDEDVVRAVVRHPVPVVCGVGHEVDVTLADFAADVRAPTPSAAAELVTVDRLELAATLRRSRSRLDATIGERLEARSRRLTAERRLLDRLSPSVQLAQSRERAGVLLERGTRAIDRLVGRRLAAHNGLGARLDPIAPARVARDHARLDRAFGVLPLLVRGRLARASSRVGAAGAALGALGPQATLDRGYAIVRRRDDGAILRDPAAVAPGDPLAIRVARGEVAARVDGSS